MAGFLDGLIALAKARGVSFSVSLGSGYNEMSKRDEMREVLKAACEEAMEKPEFAPRDGNTYCNQAARYIAERMGCYDFKPEMTANEQVAHVEANWKKADAQEAHAHAARGGLAVAAKTFPEHGHMAVCYPMMSLAASGSWGKPVPWVANIGKTNGVMATSKAFPVSSGEPSYYCWVP